MSENKIRMVCATAPHTRCQQEQETSLIKVGTDLRPLQPHPYICLSCWLAGWRHEAPEVEGAPFKVYLLPRLAS